MFDPAMKELLTNFKGVCAFKTPEAPELTGSGAISCYSDTHFRIMDFMNPNNEEEYSKDHSIWATAFRGSSFIRREILGIRFSSRLKQDWLKTPKCIINFSRSFNNRVIIMADPSCVMFTFATEDDKKFAEYLFRQQGMIPSLSSWPLYEFDRIWSDIH